MTKKIIILGLCLILLNSTHSILAATHTANFSTLKQSLLPVQTSTDNNAEAADDKDNCCNTALHDR